MVIKFVNGGFSGSKSSTSTTKSSKRDILNLDQFDVISGTAQSKLMIPGQEWSEHNVVPGAPFTGFKAVVPGASFKGEKAVVPGTPFSESKAIDIGADCNPAEMRGDSGKSLPTKREAQAGGKFRGFASRRVAFKPTQ